MRLKKTMSVAFVSALLCGAALPAEDIVPTGNFVFPMLWDDATPETATDVSFLNHKPAGVNGRIIVKNGHFIESNTGKRIRFFGFGLGVPVFFPTHDEAVKLAAHLAKAGVNVVRIHGLDNDGTNDFWGREKGTILDVKRLDTQHFQQEHLDRLFFLIAELQKNGIYINLNLKVSRRATEADGVLPYTGEAKRFDRFDRRWIELQKKYARDLLTRVNPYTGKTLAKDPGVLSIELNNENAVAETHRKLPPAYQRVYQTLWNQFLKRKYGSDNALQKAWLPWGTASLGKSLVSGNIQWKLRDKNGNEVTDFTIKTAENRNDDSAPHVILAPPRERVMLGAMANEKQLYLSGLKLTSGMAYTLRFRIRIEGDREFSIPLQLRSTDYSVSIPISRQINCNAKYQEHSIILQPVNFTGDKKFELFFNAGAIRTPMEIIDLQILPGAQWDRELSLNKENIGFNTPGTTQQFADEKDFFAELDWKYNLEMRDFLKRELKVQSLIVDSQVGFGGLTGLLREKPSDYTDVHSYWQHPDYTPPGWRIANTPQLPRIINNERGALHDLALLRVAGKPFSISEYDHPNPSEFSAEMMPELALIASLQDWDAIYVFTIGNFGHFGRSDKLTHKYDASNHPNKMGLFPAAAMIFRNGWIHPLAEGKLLHISERPWNAYGGWFDTLYQNVTPGRKLPDRLKTRLAISDDFLPFRTRSYMTEDPRPQQKEFKMSTVDREPYPALQASTDKIAILFGMLKNRSYQVGDLQAQIGGFERGFGALMLIPLDGKPIRNSDRMLLSLVSSFNNLGNVWNKERTSIDPRRGGVHGEGVVNGAFIPATFSIATPAAKVFALDSRGVRKHEVKSFINDGKLTFSTAPEDATIWYEICRKK